MVLIAGVGRYRLNYNQLSSVIIILSICILFIHYSIYKSIVIYLST